MHDVAVRSQSQLLRTGALAIIVAIVLAGCSDDTSSDSATSSTAPPSVSSTSTVEDPATPETCQATNVESTVERLIDALNTSDPAAADAIIASEPRFEWFSVDPDRLGADSFDRSNLRAFFAELAESAPEFEVVSVDFNFYRQTDRTGNFEFQLADRRGKGAIDCDSGLIMVWSMGAPEPAG
jgi:hypothetical protein